MIELKTFDGASGITDSLRFHMSSFSLENPGEKLFEHLPPGQYAVQRCQQTRTGPQSVLETDADRQLVEIESAKRANIRFERKTGRPLSGLVRGLEDVELRYAHLKIGGAQCRCEASNDVSVLRSADYVKGAWPRLPPHVRKAIVTLVAAALETGHL